MQELIKITVHNGRNAVSARELYIFLGFNSSQWARWYKQNIENNQFAIEGTDWEGFDTMSSGNPTKDFTITIDFAKRLAMMAKTEKGEQARRYFIECEQKYNKALHTTDPDELLIMLAQRNAEISREARAAKQLAEQSSARLDVLEAKAITSPSCFTIAGYAAYLRIPIGTNESARLGKAAASICRDRGITIETIHDRRYGRVNVYPEVILKEIFDSGPR